MAATLVTLTHAAADAQQMPGDLQPSLCLLVRHLFSDDARTASAARVGLAKAVCEHHCGAQLCEQLTACVRGLAVHKRVSVRDHAVYVLGKHVLSLMPFAPALAGGLFESLLWLGSLHATQQPMRDFAVVFAQWSMSLASSTCSAVQLAAFDEHMAAAVSSALAMQRDVPPWLLACTGGWLCARTGADKVLLMAALRFLQQAVAQPDVEAIAAASSVLILIPLLFSGVTADAVLFSCDELRALDVASPTLPSIQQLVMLLQGMGDALAVNDYCVAMGILDACKLQGCLQAVAAALQVAQRLLLPAADACSCAGFSHCICFAGLCKRVTRDHNLLDGLSSDSERESSKKRARAPSLDQMPLNEQHRHCEDHTKVATNLQSASLADLPWDVLHIICSYVGDRRSVQRLSAANNSLREGVCAHNRYWAAVFHKHWVVHANASHVASQKTVALPLGQLRCRCAVTSASATSYSATLLVDGALIPPQHAPHLQPSGFWHRMFVARRQAEAQAQRLRAAAVTRRMQHVGARGSVSRTSPLHSAVSALGAVSPPNAKGVLRLPAWAAAVCDVCNCCAVLPSAAALSDHLRLHHGIQGNSTTASTMPNR